MRILIIQESDWLKRNNHQQHHLAELMSLRGHEVRVIDYEIMWRQGNKEIKSDRQIFYNVQKIYDGAKVTVIRPPIIKLPVLDYISLVFNHRKEIYRQFEEFKPDVVVGFSILNSYLALSACHKYKVPFVFYWIDVLHELIPNALFRNWGRNVEMMTIDGSNLVLVINKRLKTYVSMLGADNVKVITAGVDKTKFNKDLDGSSIREQYGFKKEDTVLFFMGWLYKFSGLENIISKMAEVRNPNVKLLIAGTGDTYEELKKTVCYYHLNDSVILLGQIPYKDVPLYISASDVCILPAENNRVMRNVVPIKLYEYLAMGKPVITTRLPAVAEEFGARINYVSKPEDILELATKLKGNKYDTDIIRDWGEIANEFENVLKEMTSVSKTV